MFRMPHAGLGRPVDRFQTHEAHQPADAVAADRNAVAAQLSHHLPAAVKGIAQEQLVDSAHQRQILRALPVRRVVERRPADRENLALPAQAQARAGGRDHRLAILPAHRLSPLDKKSRSTVSCPILACRSRISASRSFCS